MYMGSKIVSSVVAEQIRTKPELKPVDIIIDFKQNYGLNISYQECDANSSRFERLYHIMPPLKGSNSAQVFFSTILYCATSSSGIKVWNKYKGHMLAATGNMEIKKCAYAPIEEAFNHHMKKLQKDGAKTIWEFLDTIHNENWSNAIFPGKKYGDMCSNLAECFNSWIVVDHEWPIFQLFEWLQVKMMVKYVARHRVVEKWTTYLCPNMEKKLQKAVDIGRHWDVSCSSEHVFELNGFSCAYAIAAILADYGDTYDYVDPYFIANYYRSYYDISIVHVPDVEKESPEGLEEFIVKPPLTKKLAGRPRIKRIKSSVEDRRANKCSRCGPTSQHSRKTYNYQI
ncbi:hypothetical protein L3X38_025002 [Prunus dulcis]|uniref:Zinc finger PMZ-type domain-containing protein n=1 Tax=Prunus dulcis TaxID=3755 RepID=A0AAD4Z714_PRUDU|nr:hypothetical protein L3X38_025002 [Prunus dulcis]